MKQITSILLALPLFLMSCATEVIEGVTDPKLVGKWGLIEVYADPGNGSGTFQEVESDAEIEFFTDGTFVANYDICTFGSSTQDSSEGVYSVTDQTITSNTCPSPGTITSYTFDGNRLIINFICIEGCAHKYRRIK